MPEDSSIEKGLSPEEEIQELERKLEEKKRELSAKGEVLPLEKEVFREVLREHIAEARPQVSEGFSTTTPPAATHILTDDLKKKSDDIKNKEKREEKVRALIEVALTKNIGDAIKIAEEATPWLLDELHDHLIDDYYDKLVALRKIKAL